MEQFFESIATWFANWYDQMPNMPEWLAALIAPVIDLFKNLSAA
jgi:hypothetical protein